MLTFFIEIVPALGAVLALLAAFLTAIAAFFKAIQAIAETAPEVIVMIEQLRQRDSNKPKE